jgi:hypothetical protein
MSGIDLSSIRWFHAVNSREKLAAAFQEAGALHDSDAGAVKDAHRGPMATAMLEVDIMGVPASSSAPHDGPLTAVLCHPPSSAAALAVWDTTVTAFMDLVRDSSRGGTPPTIAGVKLDIKTPAVVPAVVDAATHLTSDCPHVAVWLNADVVQGPGGGPVPFDAAQCLRQFSVLPTAWLSLGWTTGPCGAYTADHVAAMVSVLTEAFPNDATERFVTFPVRHSLLQDDGAVSALRGLLAMSPLGRWSLTVWRGRPDAERMTDADVQRMHALFDPLVTVDSD